MKHQDTEKTLKTQQEVARRLQTKISAKETLGGLLLLTFDGDRSFWLSCHTTPTTPLLEAALHLRMLAQELEDEFLGEFETDPAKKSHLSSVKGEESK